MDWVVLCYIKAHLNVLLCTKMGGTLWLMSWLSLLIWAVIDWKKIWCEVVSLPTIRLRLKFGVKYLWK